MSLKICVAGVTGWVGKELVPAVTATPDLELTAAVARSVAGKPLAEVLPGSASEVIVSGSVAEALVAADFDILIDYTQPSAIKGHTLAALAAGKGVVIGTTGLSGADYEDLDKAAQKAGQGAVTGNFSLTAALLQHLAALAAAELPSWEILDYADPLKLDAPSGTATELAERLGSIKIPEEGLSVAETHGPDEVRGAVLGNSRIHSIRQNSFTLSCEVVFGMPDERLTIRHDAGTSAKPYVFGTLIAARKLSNIKGLVRGLDRLLFG